MVFSEESSSTTEWNYVYQNYAFDKFMNTSDPIWVVNTTQPEAPLCTKDFNSSLIAKNETFFTRSYKTGGVITEKKLKGVFGYYDEEEANMYDKMTVYDAINLTEVDEETLEYLSENQECAVISVINRSAVYDPMNYGFAMWCDLRVRDPYLEHTNSSYYAECLKRFNEIVGVTKRNSTSPYSSDCKTQKST
uniref:Putative salivary lipocalin lipocalin n=1 Tax=Rhipicephalus microplus TaxID=6941 RepID=A0A6G5A505_RHIMP